jgi:hypothetical protein
VGKGLGQLVRSRRGARALDTSGPRGEPAADHPREPSAPPTSEIVNRPACITESTTRRLGVRLKLD